MESRKTYSKQITSPQRDKAVAAPEQAKASVPIVKNTVLDIKAVASVRVLHDGRAIVSVDGDLDTIKCSKATLTIED